MHGELSKLRSTVDENYVIDINEDQKISDVDDKGFPLRVHIVWFGENVPLFEEAINLVVTADIFLVDLEPVNITGINIMQGTAVAEVPNLVNKLINAIQDV